MAPKKKPEDPHILAVISDDEDEDDEKVLGYFKDMPAVERFFEAENIESARILTVTRVEDAAYPPEPELQLQIRRLSDVVGGRT